MESLPSDIGDLLAVAEVARRDIGDPRSASCLLKASEPSLVLLADAGGEVIFADDFESGTGTEAARTLSASLAMSCRCCCSRFSRSSMAAAMA